MINQYLFEDGKIIEEPDVIKWAKRFENADKQIALDFAGKATISTVFLGVDYNFEETGQPILFETMVFGGKHDQYQERYTTVELAIAGHRRAKDLVKGNHKTVLRKAKIIRKLGDKLISAGIAKTKGDTK